jgi:hypothetical protein
VRTVTAHVFISYRREDPDADYVSRLANFLRETPNAKLLVRVPVAWADLTHDVYVAYDDSQAMLEFPVALALDRQVDHGIGVVAFDVQVGAVTCRHTCSLPGISR